MGETPSPSPLLGACWLPSLTRRDFGARLPVFLIFIEYTWINLVIKLSDKQLGGFRVHFKFSCFQALKGWQA